MQIKLLVSAAAIALAATIGSASAADQFTTLDGIPAQTLTEQEMGTVIGGHPPGGNEFGPFGKESALTGFDNASVNGQAGLVQGFVFHAPTCASHPGLAH